MEVSGQRHVSAALYTGELTPSTHCTGGWVGLRAGLDTEAREETLLPLPGIEPRSSLVRHYTDWAKTKQSSYSYLLEYSQRVPNFCAVITILKNMKVFKAKFCNITQSLDFNVRSLIHYSDFTWRNVVVHFYSFYTDRFLNNGDELVLTCSEVLTLLTHKTRTAQVHGVGSACALCIISGITLVGCKIARPLREIYIGY
jgi:hypothetical protein